MEDKNNSPIGFFDTGVGGISVLKTAIKLMPNENFIYFGDSKNAPYGTKSIDEVRELTLKSAEFLVSKNVKAIVIACNTATSVAINDLRKIYDMPIIGVEPALKPAVELKREGKVVIMATTVTLSETKFNNLVNKCGKEAEIEPLPCPGLVEFIENGDLNSSELKSFLKDKFNKFKGHKLSSIVLGCTHYPFVKDVIKEIVGSDVPIIDGSLGTTNELKRKLEEKDLLNFDNKNRYIKIFNSSDNKNLIDLSYKLIDM